MNILTVIGRSTTYWKVFAERFVFVLFEPEKFEKVQVKDIVEVDTTDRYIIFRMCV